MPQNRLHPSTFEYLNPTDQQKTQMAKFREKTAHYAGHITEFIPEGPDRTYMLRKLREIGMWGNVAITRDADGAPRARELGG